MQTPPSTEDRLFENKLDRAHGDVLARSFRYCQLAAKRNSSTIYPGIRLLPGPQRSAMMALYSWKRRVDDAADTDGLVESRRVEIRRLRDMTSRAFGGTPPINADAFWDAFTDTVNRFNIPQPWIDSVFEGVEWDLDVGVCANEAELETYCYRIASTMMMAMVRVCGCSEGAQETVALDLAKKRGLALQLTDIVRDFAEDYDSYPRRVYLPADSFQESGLKPNAMRVWMPAEECERFALSWIRTAESAFEASAGLEDSLSHSSRHGVRLMTRLARESLAELRRAPSRMVRGRKAGPRPLRRKGLNLIERFARV